MKFDPDSYAHLKSLKIESKVCIIGAGIAGITLARELSSMGKHVTLIEAGGMGDDRFHGTLDIIDDQGALVRRFVNYQTDHRSKRFGGTSHRWANYSRPLDPIDLEKRSYLPHSGWPIDYQELSKFYPRAYEYHQVSPVVDNPVESLKIGDNFETQAIHARLPVTFSVAYGPELLNGPIRVVMNTKLLKIRAADNEAECVTRKGKPVTVKFEQIILAMGGVGNASFLMHYPNLGGPETTPHIGKYFMEHIHLIAGRYVFKKGLVPHADYNLMKMNKRSLYLTLTPAAQRAHEVTNGQIDLDPLPMDDFFTKMGAAQEDPKGYLRYILAQPPNTLSSLEKGPTKDKFGFNETIIKCHFDYRAWHSINTTLKLLKSQVGTRGVIFSLFDGPEDYKTWGDRFFLWGGHHMGTTMMGKVVDKDCKLIGSNNIYVAGSSVFPTSGHAPPTLTIVALAIRLAEHIRGKHE